MYMYIHTWHTRVVYVHRSRLLLVQQQLSCLVAGGEEHRRVCLPACLPVCNRGLLAAQEVLDFATAGQRRPSHLTSYRGVFISTEWRTTLTFATACLLACLRLVYRSVRLCRNVKRSIAFDWFVYQGCTDTGAPIMVPVGQETLGRIMNVIGEPVDERGPINAAAKVKRTRRKGQETMSLI